eukprot:Hpha_TRINITY_DN14466_c1_g2::TRINITY_DN14466_c1_g2_i1::g.157279::m.157279/K12373/HEXA_B; hexosaminidase
MRGSMLLFGLLCISKAQLCSAHASILVPPPTYTCVEGRCDIGGGEGGMELGLCKVVCEKALWPLPTGTLTIPEGTSSTPITTTPKFTMDQVPEAARGLLKGMADAFVAAAFPKRSTKQGGGTLSVQFKVSSATTELGMETNESYSLSSSGGAAFVVEADTVFGARHGLETLSQIVHWNAIQGGYGVVGGVVVTDAPAFPYRSVMVDTARNFVPIPVLRNVIKGMGAAKLNNLHLHLVDTGSFPLETPSQPNLTRYGAYSNEEVYRVTDIAELKAFALAHGVRVVPEIDQPAHAREGWE